MDQLIRKYSNTPHIEIEFRVGKINRGGFDTNVGKSVFEKALRRLSRFDKWESTSKTQTTIYYSKNGRRAISDDETDDVVRVLKNRVIVQDYPLDNQPFDIRLGISTEVPYEPDDDDEFDKLKKRTRYSFVRKNLSIDVSEIQADPDDLDNEDNVTYQIELEIIKPHEIGSDVELHNLIHKIYDVMTILRT